MAKEQFWPFHECHVAKRTVLAILSAMWLKSSFGHSECNVAKEKFWLFHERNVVKEQFWPF